MPGIPAFIAGRGVAFGIVAGLAVGAGVIITGGVAEACGRGRPESPAPDADAVATVARTPPMTSEAATNSSFSLRMIYPLRARNRLARRRRPATRPASDD
jgi:hypothetical protein